MEKIFDPQPTLDGHLILLRPLVPTDYEALYKVSSDPLLWEQHPSPLRYKREVFDEQVFNTALDLKNTLIVVDKQSGQVIGSSRYYDIDAANREVAIGLTFLARAYWGGTVNAEMKKLMIDYAFSWADKVWFHAGSENFRSIKALEKIGARLAHVKPRPVGGKPVDHAFFYMAKEDWDK